MLQIAEPFLRRIQILAYPFSEFEIHRVQNVHVFLHPCIESFNELVLFLRSLNMLLRETLRQLVDLVFFEGRLIK